MSSALNPRRFSEEVVFEKRVHFMAQPASEEAVEIAALKVQLAELKAMVYEMVACQPSDPLGDLARAEAHFEGKARKVKRDDAYGGVEE